MVQDELEQRSFCYYYTAIISANVHMRFSLGRIDLGIGKDGDGIEGVTGQDKTVTSWGHYTNYTYTHTRARAGSQEVPTGREHADRDME